MFGFFKINEDLFYKELLADNLDIDKLQKYINKGVNLNRQDEKGCTILFSLAVKRKLDAIKFLIQNGANLTIENKYGKTVLDEVIDKSDRLMIRFLLDNGYNINHQNSLGRTVCHDVAIFGNEKVFETLMNYNPNFSIKDGTGKTALFYAIEGGSLNILKDVINHTNNLNVIDENQQTPLFHAVLKENCALSIELILHGANVNFLDKDGRNVLFNALLQGAKNFSVIELLIKKGINLNITDNYGRNIIDELLYIFDLQKNFLQELDGKYTIITEDKDYIALGLFFIEHGLEVDILHEDGRTTLQIEVENKKFANVEFLLNCGADINVCDEYNRNIVYKEILKGYSNYKMIDYLVSKGADVNVRDIDEKSVVDYIVEILAVIKGFKKGDPFLLSLINHEEKYDILLKKVLTYRPNIETQRLDGTNILFDLVLYNDFETIKTIINYGVALNIRDKRGNSPLISMVEDGLKIKEKKDRELFIERLIYFLKYRVSVDVQDNEGRTVIHKAVIANDLTVVEKLLTKKANLNIKDIHGRTALHHTQWHGNYKIARWLIAGGADMNIPDNSGFTLLNYAAIFGHTKLVMALIKSGVLMYNKNPKNKKAAQFFKERESKLEKLLRNNIGDDKMRLALEEVIENLKNEINEALQ